MPVAGVDFGLAVQEAVSILTLLKLPFRDVAAISGELELVIIKLDFAFADYELVGVGVFPPTSTDITELLKVLTVFYFDKFFDATYSEVILKFEMTFLECVLEVKFALCERLKKEVILILLLEEVVDRSVEDLLYLLELIDGPVTEKVLVNTPIL